MATCFLSYSSNYSHLKDPFRRLLQVLGFEVDVFDEPHIGSPPKPVVQERLKNADAVLILYGPPKKVEGNQDDIEGAIWPHYEADLAYDLKKPLALIVHPHVKLPLILADYQTCPQFEFWNPQSFLDNTHHIVKHLLDLKRLVDLPEGSQPYYFKKVIYRYRIYDSGVKTKICVYNDIVARQVWRTFLHKIDTGGDMTPDAMFSGCGPESYSVEALPDSDFHRVQMSPTRCTNHEFEYIVNIDPPLAPGERFGYQRSFVVPNRFPLTKSELISRSQKEGYPSIFPQNFYGDLFETPYEMDRVTLAIHFPSKVKIVDRKVLVTHSLSHEENKQETNRCRDFLRLHEEPGEFEHILELRVPRPIINHNYYLLYSPG